MSSKELNRRYEFVLPPGWVRLDLRKSLPEQASRYVTAILQGRDLQGRKAEITTALQQKVLAQAASSKEKGVLDLVLPTFRDTGIVSSSTIAIFPLELPSDTDTVEFLAAMAMKDETAKLVEIADLVALRVESKTETQRPDDQQAQVAELASQMGLATAAGAVQLRSDAKFFSRKIMYFIGHPDRVDDWVIMALSVIEDDNPQFTEAVDILAELFDTLVLTVKFDG